MKRLTIAIFFLLMPLLSHAQSSLPLFAVAELTGFANGVATYSVQVCNANQAEIRADVSFTPIGSELTTAEIKIFVSNDPGYCAGGRKPFEFNVENLLRTKIREAGISSSSVLLRSIPARLEIMQIR